MFQFFCEHEPSVVILAAARVGGILANATFPVDYLSENLLIELNVLDAARSICVPKLLLIGSSAAYPMDAENTIHEDALMSGALNPAHASYALAKLSGLEYVRLMRETGAEWVSVMPTNLYGPNDNFNVDWSHVMPGLIHRFHQAVMSDQRAVVIWGDGTAKREFVYSDDLADACLTVLERRVSSHTINIGSGEEITIRNLAESIADAAGFVGEITFDATKPAGAARRLLDSSTLRGLGWEPRTNVATGVRRTYKWFADQWPDVRR